MSYQSIESSVRDAANITPRQPAEVFCATDQQPSPDPADAAASPHGAGGAPAGGSQRAGSAPLRSLDAVMQAFREQRRLAQEEGSPGAVIGHILSRTGHGSLAADLSKPH